jgi:hypothetical protein
LRERWEEEEGEKRPLEGVRGIREVYIYRNRET